MFFNTYLYGMNFAWWLMLAALLFWVFATPYAIPGQRMWKPNALDILKKRYAAGYITKEEYTWKKEIIESDLAKLSRLF